MDSSKNVNGQTVSSKKDMRKEMVTKLELALPELRQALGEKKFHNRLKKAAKLLMDGMNKADVPKKAKMPAVIVVNAKKASKKATAKKSAKKAAAQPQ